MKAKVKLKRGNYIVFDGITSITDTGEELIIRGFAESDNPYSLYDVYVKPMSVMDIESVEISEI